MSYNWRKFSLLQETLWQVASSDCTRTRLPLRPIWLSPKSQQRKPLLTNQYSQQVKLHWCVITARHWTIDWVCILVRVSGHGISECVFVPLWYSILNVHIKVRRLNLKSLGLFILSSLLSPKDLYNRLVCDQQSQEDHYYSPWWRPAFAQGARELGVPRLPPGRFIDTMA